PAYYMDNRSSSNQTGAAGSYTLLPQESVEVHFLYPASGCDSQGKNCSGGDPTALGYGPLQVQYTADDPGFLRGLAKAEVPFPAQTGGRTDAWPATEKEVDPAQQWKVPISVTWNKAANPGSAEDASAAVANPGSASADVLVTLFDTFGTAIATRTITVPGQG